MGKKESTPQVVYNVTPDTASEKRITRLYQVVGKAVRQSRAISMIIGERVKEEGPGVVSFGTVHIRSHSILPLQKLPVQYPKTQNEPAHTLQHVVARTEDGNHPWISSLIKRAQRHNESVYFVQSRLETAKRSSETRLMGRPNKALASFLINGRHIGALTKDERFTAYYAHGLSDNERFIVESMVQGKKHTEIAAAIKISRGSVGYIFDRAKKKFL
jgi:hypothetical protein